MAMFEKTTNIGHLFITTHGVINMDGDSIPQTNCPFKTTKLNAVPAGVCNFYQSGMPNLLPMIMRSVDLSNKPIGTDTAEHIKQQLITFENDGPKLRSGPYLPTMMEQWRKGPDKDPDVQTFFLLGDARYSINSYEVDSPITNKTYTIYKDEDKSGSKLENRIFLYLNSSPPIDVIETWRNKGLDGCPAKSVILKNNKQINITLKGIFDIMINSGIELDELVIIDLTCSVLFDITTGKEIENPRFIRHIRRNAASTKKKKKKKKKKNSRRRRTK